MTTSINFPGLVQAFFTDRLLQQREASPNTVAGYRDTFRILLRFAAERLRKDPWRRNSVSLSQRLSMYLIAPPSAEFGSTSF